MESLNIVDPVRELGATDESLNMADPVREDKPSLVVKVFRDNHDSVREVSIELLFFKADDRPAKVPVPGVTTADAAALERGRSRVAQPLLCVRG